jgi:hypothetical protein
VNSFIRLAFVFSIVGATHGGQASARLSALEAVVYRGQPVTRTAAPWKATVRIVYGSGGCTATFVHVDTLVTSSHCFKDTPAGSTLTLTYFEGTNPLKTIELQPADFSVAKHQKYFDGNTAADRVDTDIAVVTIDASQILPTDSTTVELNSRDQNRSLVRGLAVIAGGAGRQGNGPSGRLRYVRGFLNDIVGDKLEMDIVDGGLCVGDSGGPLFVSTDKGYRLAGVLSETTTELEGDCGGSADFTHVSASLIEWIDSTTYAARRLFDEKRGI